MQIPEVTLGTDGRVESVKSLVIPAAGGIPAGTRVGLGVTNGVQVGMVSIDKDGNIVVEQEGDTNKP